MNKTFWQLTHDERSKLCKDDPAAFENLWKAECNPQQARQMWRLQAELRNVKNPVERCNRAGAKMLQSLEELRNVLNGGF